MPPATGKHTGKKNQVLYSPEPSLQRNSVPFKVCSWHVQELHLCWVMTPFPGLGQAP